MDRSRSAGPPAWEMAKVFWDGSAPGDRRRVWFSHRDPVEFGPGDYEDVLWRLGETGFEPVAYQAWLVPEGAAAPDPHGPAGDGLREVTLFRRSLGAEPGGHRHPEDAAGEAG